MLGHIPCFVVVWACECLLRGKVVECVLFIGRIISQMEMDEILRCAIFAEFRGTKSWEQ